MEILYTVHDVNKTGILALVDEHGYILYFLLSMVHHDCKFVNGGNGNSLHWNINKISLKIFFFQKQLEDWIKNIHVFIMGDKKLSWTQSQVFAEFFRK